MTNEIKVKKLTKKDRFNQLLEIPAVQADAELVAFIEHELELLTNKNKAKDGEKKLTEKQLENEKVKEILLNFMEPNNLYAVSDFQKKVEVCAEMSNQKVSALLRQLKLEEKVERIEDKRKVFWKLA